MIGVTTRFTTAVSFEAGFVLGALVASAVETIFASGLANNFGSAFDFSTCFVIDFLDDSAFTLGFDVNLFETLTLTADFVWAFDFGLTLDLTAMTHILSFL
jgi:hypothetical protein